MTRAYEVDAAGREHRLRNPNEGPGGEHDIVPRGEQHQAGLMGVLHLLDQIAKRDENLEFRRAARVQANVIRGLMGVRTRDYGGDVDALPSQPKLGAAQPVLTIDDKTGDIS